MESNGAARVLGRVVASVWAALAGGFTGHRVSLS